MTTDSAVTAVATDSAVTVVTTDSAVLAVTTDNIQCDNDDFAFITLCTSVSNCCGNPPVY